MLKHTLKARKVTGVKPLRVKCGEFNQVTSKWQTDVLEKT